MLGRKGLFCFLVVNTGLCQGKETHNTRWVILATHQVQKSHELWGLAPLETQGSSLKEEVWDPTVLLLLHFRKERRN